MSEQDALSAIRSGDVVISHALRKPDDVASGCLTRTGIEVAALRIPDLVHDGRNNHDDGDRDKDDSTGSHFRSSSEGDTCAGF